TCFTPVISEFKDFIAAPKFNLYQSLHTAVAAPDGAVAEVLIRTHQMHKVAEAGVVALGNPYTPPATADAGAEAAEDGERADLAEDQEITVFRADGGTLGLPAGASCVDAAYAQHGEAAHGCLGARVNGRLATLSTVLVDGDTVQLLLAQDATSGPSPQWLDHARTQAARIAITTWLRAHPEAAKAPDADPRPPSSVTADRRSGTRILAELPGSATAAVRPAGCCTPVPPDEITGFLVRGGSVTVHRTGCASVDAMRRLGREPVVVHWGDTAECRVTLVAESFGRPHLLADLTEAIAGAGVAVVAATVEPPSEQRVRHTYTLQLPDAAGLPALMRAMRDVPGVYDVSRARHPASPQD
ncbi:bifunctional (p)ppGpp synthetase/guanosine-3',5'-bis(diphosphate) 3'-pyrophosphohydrolase, partial [Streptomyces sp. ms191]|uniref:TGS domain-containing protein n=1 Tax=Streptomyces sp. ms191 TaxID=1827978 RepID=UPI0011CD3860